MHIRAVTTEKSLNEAKKGRYSFWVNPKMTKIAIKKAIEVLFPVKVINVRTANLKGGIRRSVSGKYQTIKSKKRAIVILATGQTIDIFETEKKAKPTKKGKTNK